MNKKIMIYMMIGLIFVLPTLAFPDLLNQHGVLRNSTTNQVINGTHTINFTIYNLSNSAQVYSEEKSLLVTNGVYNYVIGETEDINEEIFNHSLYVQIKINGEQSGPTNMTAVPFSFYSLISNNSYYLNGLSSEAYTPSNLTSTDIEAFGFLTFANTTSYTTQSYVDGLNGTWQDFSDNLSYADIESMNFTTHANFSVTDANLSYDGNGNYGIGSGFIDWLSQTFYKITQLDILLGDYVNETSLINNNNSVITYVDSQDVIYNDSIKLYVDSLNNTWADNSDNLTDSDIEAFGYLKFINTTIYLTTQSLNNNLTSLNNTLVTTYASHDGVSSNLTLVNTSLNDKATHTGLSANLTLVNTSIESVPDTNQSLFDARYINDGESASGDLTGTYPGPTIDYTTVTLNDFTNDAGFIKNNTDVIFTNISYNPSTPSAVYQYSNGSCLFTQSETVLSIQC